MLILMIKAPFVIWLHKLQGMRKAKQSSVTQLTLATPSAGKVKATVFWDAEGVTLVYITLCGQTITQICTFTLLKPCKSFSGESDMTKILLKSFFNTARPHTSLKT